MNRQSQSAIFAVLEDKKALLMDGATGTNLFAMGLVSGDAPELWNDEHPDRVLKLNAGFVEAGSDVILTNTFGGNAMRLKLHASESRVAELNEKGAAIAVQAAKTAERKVFVAGSIGPLGELFEPMGAITMDIAVECFEEQARALERGGCDVLWIETLSSKEELIAAAAAASRTELPFACNASFDTKGRTMMGISPKEFSQTCKELPSRPFAVGSNCGVGPAQTVAAVLEMTEFDSESFEHVAKANCGIPIWEGAKLRYSATPEQMAVYVHVARAAGASIIGGCCGTTSSHVAAMRAAMDDYEPMNKPTHADIEQQLGEVFNTEKPEKQQVRRRRRR